MSGQPPVSPCVSVCVLDPMSGFCRGCLRTVAEIASWPRLSPDQKRAVIAALPGRRGALHGAHAGGGAPAS